MYLQYSKKVIILIDATSITREKALGGILLSEP